MAACSAYDRMIEMTGPTAPTWVFAKGRDRLHIRRTGSTDVSVERADTAERLHFESAVALLEFQVALERRLLASGWQFAGFTPERRREARRTRRERRARALQFP
jgi:hypothetical protein